MDMLPLGMFKLIGESPYFDARPDEITCRSNASLEGEFTCARQGEYVWAVRAYSTPAAGKYSVLGAVVDGKEIGQVEIASDRSKSFEIGRMNLAEGKHKVRLIYANDLYQNGEDRNLFIQGVGAGIVR
jgi:hypothetical protein